MINIYSEDILNYIINNDTCIEELINCFYNININIKLNAAMCLIDICNYSQPLQIEIKKKLFSRIIETKLFSFFIHIIAYNEYEINKQDIKIEFIEDISYNYGIKKLDLLKSRLIDVISECMLLFSSNNIFIYYIID